MTYSELSRPRFVFVFICLLVLCTPYLLAQTAGTGAISGTVTDPAGAVVPRVAVTAVRADTGESRATTTDASGAFRFALLLPGQYQLKFSVVGFKAVEVSSTQVNVTETTVVNQTLEIGSQTQEVTVEATAQRLQTETSTVGEVVGQEKVSTLPLVNRNYTQILTLAAGVQGSVTNAAVLGKGTQDVVVNGGTGSQNNYQQDGVEINDYSSGQASVIGNYSGIGIPNPDSIEEFKIQTSNFDAGYGRNPGANVNVVTKSGTNTFHGALWEFLRNTDLNANDFFQNRNGGSRLTFQQNQFGGTFGGRIIKDKLFFFGSYQGTRQVNGVAPQGHSTSLLPPLTNNRSAAALGAEFCPQNNPTSKTFFPETVQVACDGSNINPAALNLLNAKFGNGYYIPTPQTIQANGQGFSSFSIPAYFTEDQYLANVDYVMSPKHTLSSRYFYVNNPQTIPMNTYIIGQLPGDPDTRLNGNISAILKLTSILTPNLVNEARISYLRNSAVTTTGLALTNPQIGITPISPDYPVLSTINVTGLFLSGGQSPDQSFLWTNQFQWADQLSWTHGRHTIRTGFQAERVQWHYHYLGSERGTINFSSFADLLLGQSAATNGSALGLGNLANASGALYLPGGLDLPLRFNDFNSFVQDDIKVNSRLTLNLGVRWEFDGLMSNTNGLYQIVWQSLLESQPIPPAGGSFVGYTVPPNYPQSKFPLPAGIVVRPSGVPVTNGQPLTNFAPRLGFAWQPLANGRMVIRGGAGYFFDRTRGNDFINSLTIANPPFAVNEGYVGAAEAQGTFQNPWVPFNNFGFVPRTANFTTGTSSNIVSYSIAQDLPTPLVQEYNLNLQYQLPARMLLEVGYVGSHGIHQNDKQGINQPYLASPSNPINGITTNTTQNAVLRVPYVGFGSNGVTQIQDWGGFRYNSLIASLKKSLSHGVQFGAAYTWNSDLTNMGIATSGGGFSSGAFAYNDVRNTRAMWGPSNIARAQRIVINYNWAIPGPHRTTGFAGKILNGWSVSGVTIAQTGFFMTPTDGRAGTIYGSVGIATGTPCPGFTAAQFQTVGSVASRITGYFNPAAFCAPAAIGNGTGYGILGPADVVGPAQFNWDAAILKTTIVGGLSEGARLDFRTEFFNAFNHPQFSNPGLAIGTASFGQITSTSVQPRLIQFALKYVF